MGHSRGTRCVTPGYLGCRAWPVPVCAHWLCSWWHWAEPAPRVPSGAQPGRGAWARPRRLGCARHEDRALITRGRGWSYPASTATSRAVGSGLCSGAHSRRLWHRIERSGLIRRTTDERGSSAIGRWLAPLPSATAGCHAVNGLPDSRCTPGATDPAVTESNIDSTICVAGYSAKVRPPESVTEPIKRTRCGRTASPSRLSLLELDHLSLCRRGRTGRPRTNLWTGALRGAHVDLLARLQLADQGQGRKCRQGGGVRRPGCPGRRPAPDAGQLVRVRPAAGGLRLSRQPTSSGAEPAGAESVPSSPVGADASSASNR